MGRNPPYDRCVHEGCRHSPARHNETGCEGCECPGYARRKRHEWRERCVEIHFLAYLAWEAEMEEWAIGYETERREYRRDHPSPKYRDVLIAMRFKEQEEELDVRPD